VKITVPQKFDEIKANMNLGYYLKDTNLTITFYDNGTVNLVTTRINITKPITTVAPNGLFVVDGANIRVKGTVQGRVTIAALEKTSGAGGNVYIDDDIKLKTMGSDPTLGDLLGICADNDIIVTDNSANNNDGIDIQATMMARTGSFYAENVFEPGYGTNSRIVSGRKNIRLIGGICQDKRGIVSVSSSTFYGFRKAYDYDGRLMRTRPPFFPMMEAFEILSWWE
jgi:hypothetical protein